jgi:hypothetical protein
MSHDALAILAVSFLAVLVMSVFASFILGAWIYHRGFTRQTPVPVPQPKRKPLLSNNAEIAAAERARKKREEQELENLLAGRS